MKAVMISIRPKWWGMIANGQKIIEVRRNKPKQLKPPFKCYIYCTKGGRHNRNFGRVFGEFVCDKVFDLCIEMSDPEALPGYPFPGTGLTDREILQYLGNGKLGYGWRISNLKIYEKPLDISDFKQCHKCEYFRWCRDRELSCDGTYVLHRPPQSWCYVEDML